MSIGIPSHMRAARLSKFGGPYVVESVPVPELLSPRDVLIRVKAASWCHTDSQVVNGDYESRGTHLGQIGSHEGVGVVVKLGAQAEKEGRLQVGDVVGSLAMYGACESCDSCRITPQLCDTLQGSIGITMDGAFAEYFRADSHAVLKVPSSIPFTEASPLFCAGATMYGALQVVEATAGQWIAFIGIGGVGHLGVQYAKALGLKVVAIDVRPEAIELAKNNLPSHLVPDVTYVINSEEAKARAIRELQAFFYPMNPGVDKVIIATDDPKMIVFAQQFLRKGGVLCDIGLPADANLEVDSFALAFKHQSIRGSLLCNPDQCQEMINLHVSSGSKTHIGQVFKLEEINELIDTYKSGRARGRLCISLE